MKNPTKEELTASLNRNNVTSAGTTPAIEETNPMDDFLKVYREFIPKYDRIINDMNSNFGKFTIENIHSSQKQFNNLVSKYKIKLYNDVCDAVLHVEGMLYSPIEIQQGQEDQFQQTIDQIILMIGNLKQALIMQILNEKCFDFTNSFLHILPVELNRVIDEINHIFGTKYANFWIGNEKKAERDENLSTIIGNIQTPICPTCRAQGDKLEVADNGIDIKCKECNITFPFVMENTKEITESPIKFVDKKEENNE